MILAWTVTKQFSVIEFGLQDFVRYQIGQSDAISSLLRLRIIDAGKNFISPR